MQNFKRKLLFILLNIFIFGNAPQYSVGSEYLDLDTLTAGKSIPISFFQNKQDTAMTYQMNAAYHNFRIHLQKKEFKSAHENYVAYDSLKGIVQQEERSIQVGKKEMKNELALADAMRVREADMQRQQELAKTERKNLLQGSVVLIIIIVLIFVATKSKKILQHFPDKIFGLYLNENSIAIGMFHIIVLLFFETILVFVDPWIETFTEGAPIYNILINGLIACGIFPINLFIQRRLVHSEFSAHTKDSKNSTIGKHIKMMIWPFLYITLVSASFPQNDQPQENKLFGDDDFASTLEAIKLKNTIDTNELYSIHQIAWELKNTNPDSALKLGHLALELTRKLNVEDNQKKRHRAICYENLGVYNWIIGESGLSLSQYAEALDLYEMIDNASGISSVTGKKGAVYLNQSNFPEALHCFLKALEIDSMMGNAAGIAKQLGNLGVLYNQQGNMDRALYYYFLALDKDSALGNQEGMSRHFGNIGGTYLSENEPEKAIYYFKKTLKIDSALNNLVNMSAFLGNIGSAYQDLGKIDSALYFLFHALKIDSALENRYGMTIKLGNIGSLYVAIGRDNEAEPYLQKALSIANEIEYLQAVLEWNTALSGIYAAQNKYDYVVHHDTLYGAAKYMIFNEERSLEIGRIEEKHEYKMTEFNQKLLEEKRAKLALEAKNRRDYFQYALITISIFLLFGFVFFFARFKVSDWLIELFVFLPFLLLFEALLNFADPFLNEIAQGELILKLGINVLLAVGIVFLDDFFEKKLKKRVHFK